PQAALSWLLAACAGAAQRDARIAVCEAFHVRVLDGCDGSASEVALPTSRPRATQLAVEWASAAINQAQRGELDPEAARASARERLAPHADPGINGYLIVRAALRLGIP